MVRPLCSKPAEPKPKSDLASPLRLAEVLGAGLPIFLKKGFLLAHQRKVVRAIQRCHTAALGAHIYRCMDCQAYHLQLHCCRNRHCPRCQGEKAAQWLENQRQCLLPIPYFHLVFTLPHRLNPLVLQNQQPLYDLLFQSVSQTLLEFGQRRFKGQLGITAVLHTWGQNLSNHYHLHCVVTGGALGRDGSAWISAKDYYLFSVKALSKVFGGKFRAGLRKLYTDHQLQFHGQLRSLAQPQNFEQLLAQAAQRNWVVFAKKPFAGPMQVLKYLSLYTHRIAISERRLEHLDKERGTIGFNYKDYADKNRRKSMTLKLEEFVRRFLLHILPERFVKIRHYGLLINRERQSRIQKVRLLLAPNQEPEPVATPSQTLSLSAWLATLRKATQSLHPTLLCPQCGSQRMRLWRIVRPGPEIQSTLETGPKLTDTS